jgi:hypothetical protein
MNAKTACACARFVLREQNGMVWLRAKYGHICRLQLLVMRRMRICVENVTAL